jgi:hypothetical protein
MKSFIVAPPIIDKRATWTQEKLNEAEKERKLLHIMTHLYAPVHGQFKWWLSK